MTNNIDPTFIEALSLVGALGSKFLELGSLLRKLQSSNFDNFKTLYEIPQLGRRKAYYLIEIDKVFGGKPELAVRLNKIGWTKLSLLAKFVNDDNILDALQFAELHTAWDMQVILKSGDSTFSTRSVLLRFTLPDFDKFASKIVAYGAKPTPDGGYHNKEAALLAALQATLD